MPLQSIAFGIPSRTTDLDADHTPAELPSGRVRFSDELGRETALAARRERAAAASESARSKDDAPNRADEGAHSETANDAANERVESNVPGRVATSRGPRSKPGASTNPSPAAKRGATADGERAAAKSGDDADEVALALAALGLAPAPEIQELPRTLAGSLLEASTADVETGPIGAPAASPRFVAVDATPAEADAKSIVGELLRAAIAKPEAVDLHGTAPAPAETPSAAANALGSFPPLLESSAVAPDTTKVAPPPSAAKAPAADPTPADLRPRVALSDVPLALPALLDRLEPEMRFGRRGRSWEVELRLDPPELGSLHFKIALHGDEIRGVVQCEPRVERLLGPVLKDLEENLRQHGGGATFDLHREAKGEERPSAPRATSPGSIPAVAAGPRAPSRAPDPSRLVDVTA